MGGAVYCIQLLYISIVPPSVRPYSTVRAYTGEEQLERRSDEIVRMAQEHYFPWRPGW